MLHTDYCNRKRISNDGLMISEGNGDGKLLINVCLGTGCYSRGAQNLLHERIKNIETKDYANRIDVRGSFCFESCNRGPVVLIGKALLEKCTLEMALTEIENHFIEQPA